MCATADILVAAIGRAGIRDAGFVKPGATVDRRRHQPVTDGATARRLFEPGSQRLADFDRRGSLVVGDVHPVCRSGGRAHAGARRRRVR